MEFPLADDLIAAVDAAGLLSSAHIRQDADFRTIVWKSANPAVEEALELQLSVYPSLYWFGGYMYDFPGPAEETPDHVVPFLQVFFEERIIRGIKLNSGGGPIWTDEVEYSEFATWFREPGTEIRSWRGSHDTTVTSEAPFPWLRSIRLLQPAEVPEVAAFYIDIQADTVPTIHPLHEVIDYITNIRLPQASSYVLEQNGKILGWIDFAGGWVNHLYVRRGETGKGIGKQLLDYAKLKNPKGLQLWTFQINEKARRFYQREGFQEVELTDGKGNEEKQPDVRLEWRKV